MTREEVCVAGFNIVQSSGVAKNTLFDALESASHGNFEKAQELIDRASELICKAQSLQDLFKKEVKEKNCKMKFVVEHGNDHLMTTIIFRDLVADLTADGPCCKQAIRSLYKRYH